MRQNLEELGQTETGDCLVCIVQVLLVHGLLNRVGTSLLRIRIIKKNNKKQKQTKKELESSCAWSPTSCTPQLAS